MKCHSCTNQSLNESKVNYTDDCGCIDTLTELKCSETSSDLQINNAIKSIDDTNNYQNSSSNNESSYQLKDKISVSILFYLIIYP